MTHPRILPYALSNPLSVLLNKAPRDFPSGDFLKVIDKRGSSASPSITPPWTANSRSSNIPVADAAQAETILAEGRAGGRLLPFQGHGGHGACPTFTSFPFSRRPSSIRSTTKAWISSAGISPRTATSRRSPRTTSWPGPRPSFEKNTGLELQALGELEFFLLSEKAQNIYSGSDGSRAITPRRRSSRAGPILNEMVRHITQITGAVKYAHSEVGFVDSVRSDIEEIRDKRAEQLEIEFLPRPIAEMADDIVLGRWLIRNIAYRHGCVATFTPKIEEGVAGNGLHFHLELVKDGTERHDRSGRTSLPSRPAAADRRALRIRRFPDRLRQHGLVGLSAARSQPGSADAHLLERPQSERPDPGPARLDQRPPSLPEA